MAILFSQTDDSAPLKLAGDIDIYDANILRDKLQEFLETHSEILLDLSAVESCDLSTVQLLYAAQKSAQKLDRRLSIIAVSKAVTGTFAMLGLTTEQFGIRQE